MASGCNQYYSYVEFNNILPTDTSIVVNEGHFPVEWTVDDLVNNNPQFFFAPGIMGVYTLHTHVQIIDVDMVITVHRGMMIINSTAGFVKGRPDDRRYN